VICSANITNKRVAGSTGGTGGGVTIPPTSTLAAAEMPASGSSPVVSMGIFALGFALFIGQRAMRAIAARRAAAIPGAHSDQRR